MSSQNDIVQEGKLLSEQERVAFRMISTGNDQHALECNVADGALFAGK